MIQFAIFLIFPAIMCLAGSMDLFTMTIPNRITLGLAAAFVVALPFSGLDLMGIASHFAAGFLMLLVGIFMFTRGWLGGGDAKLLAAASLWLGFEWLFPYLIYVAMTGGTLVACILLYRSLALPAVLCRQAWAVRLHTHGGGIPYGIALAAGGLWIYPHTAWFANLAV